MLHIFLNDTGICAAELHISSIKTFVTTRSWRAFFCNSSAEVVRAGSSSRSRSLDVSMRRSKTFCNVAFRYVAPFHLAYTDNIFVATQFLRRSSASFSIKPQYHACGNSQNLCIPVSSTSCPMRASSNTKPRPLESNILSSDIVISSTSVLGQASQRAIVNAMSLMSNYQV